MIRIAFPILFIASLIFDPRSGMASSGRFDCKVKKIDITEFIEGQVKTYGAWNDLRVNDRIELEYGTRILDGSSVDVISDLLMMTVGIIKADQLIEFDDGAILVESLPIGPSSKIWLGEDYISAYSGMFGKKALAMRRYYKNDWEAIITKLSHDDSMLESSTVALSCRHKKDSIKQIIAELQAVVSAID